MRSWPRCSLPPRIPPSSSACEPHDCRACVLWPNHPPVSSSDPPRRRSTSPSLKRAIGQTLSRLRSPAIRSSGLLGNSAPKSTPLPRARREHPAQERPSVRKIISEIETVRRKLRRYVSIFVAEFLGNLSPATPSLWVLFTYITSPFELICVIKNIGYWPRHGLPRRIFISRGARPRPRRQSEPLEASSDDFVEADFLVSRHPPQNSSEHRMK